MTSLGGGREVGRVSTAITTGMAAATAVAVGVVIGEVARGADKALRGMRCLAAFGLFNR